MLSWALVAHIIALIACSGRAIARPPRCVFLRGYRQVERLAFKVQSMQLLEERNAPLATGSSAEALGDLTRDHGLFALNEVRDFAQRNMKAEAHMVVAVHGGGGYGKAANCESNAVFPA